MAPQLIPAGFDVTVPLPKPGLLTERVNVCTLNVAVTLVAAFIVTAHVVPEPEQPPPLQPANVEPPAGLAVSVTEVPELYEAEQVAPQLIPAGFDVTVPLPDPPLFTVRTLDPRVVVFKNTETVPDA